MVERRSGSKGRGQRFASITLASCLLALLVVPVATLGGLTGSSAAASSGPASSAGFSATVTWNGANIGNYTSATSAARIGFNAVVDVQYTWNSVLGDAQRYTISDARLQIFYFGFALATRDVLNSSAGPALAGAFTMNWTTGSLQYILEGSYRLVASLLAPNGTTMWSQTFWVFVAAPFYVGAALPIILIVIILWELYNVATVGKLATLSRTSGSPPAAGSGGESGGSSSPMGSSTPSASEPSTPEADAPPGSGGGS